MRRSTEKHQTLADPRQTQIDALPSHSWKLRASERVIRLYWNSTRLAVSDMRALGFRISFGHVRAMLGFAKVLVVGAVIDLAVHPYLTRGGGRSWSSSSGRGGHLGSRSRCHSASGTACCCRGWLLCEGRHDEHGSGGQQEQSFLQDCTLRIARKHVHVATNAFIAIRLTRVTLDSRRPVPCET